MSKGAYTRFHLAFSLIYPLTRVHGSISIGSTSLLQLRTDLHLLRTYGFPPDRRSLDGLKTSYWFLHRFTDDYSI